MPITGGAVSGLLSGLPGDIGLSGFAILVCLLIVTGGIPTRRQLRDTQADRDYWRNSADKWQQVAAQHGMTLERHTQTLEKLLDYAEGTHHMVAEIQGAARGGGT